LIYRDEARRSVLIELDLTTALAKR